MWIDDVVTHTTIRSVWGNQVRDRLVQTFADMGEANTRLAALPTGSVCHLDSTGLLYHKFANSWRPMLPATVDGAVAGGGLYLTGQQSGNILTYTIPAGYGRGLWSLMVMMNAIGQPVAADVSVYNGGGATLIGKGQYRVFNAADQTFSLLTGVPVALAGDTGVVVVKNLNAAASGDLTVSANGYYTRLAVLLTP